MMNISTFSLNKLFNKVAIATIVALLPLGLFAQRTITGTVNNEQGDPIAGATVQVVGTTSGALTGSDGKYSLSVSGDDAVIRASYLGYQVQEVTVGSNSVINFSMVPGDLTLNETVITALGISREAKSLTYSAQNVDTEELSEARDLNVINSLSGKVAGISISPNGGGVGTDSRVILRGNRSIFGNSQPLYIVDGVPILGDITDVNPDDIASISVLKGPNAAALYGNRANNGAIIITTKKGTAGRLDINVSTTLMFNDPILLNNYQDRYAQGNAGIYNGASEDSWGPEISGQNVAHWSPDPNFPVSTYNLESQSSNVEDFFQTGYNSATNISISGGTEKAQTYFSYTYTNAEGIVPGNDMARHNVHLRITNRLLDRLTLDAKVNYIREDIDNQLATGESFANPVRHALRLPRTIRTQDVSIFEYTDDNGANRQHYWNPGSNGGANPYWTINRNLNERNTDRIVAFASLKYDISDDLFVQVRSAVDRINRQTEDILFNDSYIIADDGRFTVGTSEAYEWNNDILISYSKQLTKDLFISVNAGANSRIERGSSLSGRTDQPLIVPNFFTLSNTSNNIASFGFGQPRDVNSVYGFAQVSFKEGINLDITARNDWSSTLPSDNWSFFYPSVGLNVVLNDLMTLPTWFTFAKLRGSWAQVGNDTNPFQTLRTASVGAGGNNGFLSISNTIPNEDLRPEETVSVEIGADLRFLDGRIGLDLTYYQTNSRDQLFSVALPVGSGASEFFTNGGDVENRGIEAILSLNPIRTSDFRWDIDFNFTRNVSEVIKINDERPRIQVGSDFLRAFFIEQGEEWGNVYSRGFVRDDLGRIIVDADGIPQVTGGRTVQVANYNPDWLGGIRNVLSFKDLSLSFLVDIRQGGSVTSMTNAIVYGGGHTEETLFGREGAVFGTGEWAQWGEAVNEDGSPNNTTITAEEFWNRVGGRNAPAGEAFAVDASNIRLRELVLGYKLPFSLGPLSSLKLSFVGRNLFFITNEAEDFDPEVLTTSGKVGEGFNSFAPPTMRSFGLNLQLQF